MALAFFYLLYSGIMIFLHFPELYWGKVGFRGYPAVFRLEDWGISWERAEGLGDRRWGRSYHYLFAWVFLINGAFYVGWNLWQRKFHRKMLPGRDDLKLDNVRNVVASKLSFRRRAVDESERYNVVQKISYLLVLFMLFPLMIITGVAQMPAFNAISPELIDLFGGRQTARTLHVVFSLALVVFVIVHLFEVFVTGPLNRVRSMITGKYELPRQPPDEGENPA
jgi:thiosulfate reductase cytochrome b subunit